METRPDKNLLIAFPAIFGCLVALLILLFTTKRNEEYTMETTGWIAISVALLGVAGTIFGVYLQMKRDSNLLKRDGKTIDSISDSTIDMKPRVEQIQGETVDIRKKVSESLIPMLNQMVGQDESTKKWLQNNASSVAASLKTLTDEVEFQQRLKSEISSRAETRDSMVARIDLIYSENARLTTQVHEQEKELAEKDRLIFDLNVFLENEKKRNKALNQTIQRITPPTRDIDDDEPRHKSKDQGIEL